MGQHDEDVATPEISTLPLASRPRVIPRVSPVSDNLRVPLGPWLVSLERENRGGRLDPTQIVA